MKNTTANNLEHLSKINKNPRQNKHTSGEWNVTEDNEYRRITIFSGSKFITEMDLIHYHEKDEAKANAEHICKAVNLHDELIEMLKFALDTGDFTDSHRKTIEITLAKATGTPEGITSQGFD